MPRHYQLIIEFDFFLDFSFHSISLFSFSCFITKKMKKCVLLFFLLNCCIFFQVPIIHNFCYRNEKWNRKILIYLLLITVTANRRLVIETRNEYHVRSGCRKSAIFMHTWCRPQKPPFQSNHSVKNKFYTATFVTS